MQPYRVDLPARADKDTGLREPQPHHARVLAARWVVGATGRQTFAERGQIDLLTGRGHILNALDHDHTVEVQKNVTRQVAVKRNFIFTNVVKVVAKFSEAARTLDDAIGDEAELAIVRQLAPVVGRFLALTAFSVVEK